MGQAVKAARRERGGEQERQTERKATKIGLCNGGRYIERTRETGRKRGTDGKIAWQVVEGIRRKQRYRQSEIQGDK